MFAKLVQVFGCLYFTASLQLSGAEISQQVLELRSLWQTERANAVKKLDDNYENALYKLKRSYQDKADLAGAKAVDAELKALQTSLEAGDPLPELEKSAPEGLKQHRGTWQKHRAKLLEPVDRQYALDLRKLKDYLTRQGKLADATSAADELKLVEESLKSRAPLEISAQQAGDTKTLEIANGVEMTFCWVPAGQFKMGSPESEAGRVDDEAQVKVTLTRGFWLGQTEVTQAQWEAVMGSNPSHFQGKNLPVEKVSWDMVQGFLEKANASARLPSGGKLMLPTEAQWEYACRAGERGPHSGGRIDQVAWFKDNNGGTTQPVGKKKANAWGLRDMLGNACEWCADWHADALAGGRDPQGPDAGSCRVARGGSLYYDASFCRCARRMQLDPTFTAPDLGFRVALIPVPEAR